MVRYFNGAIILASSYISMKKLALTLNYPRLAMIETSLILFLAQGYLCRIRINKICAGLITLNQKIFAVIVFDKDAA